MNKKILVTGATGFIGSAFIRYCLRNKLPYDIIGFSRYSDMRNQKRLSRHEKNSIHLIHGDLLWDISGLCEGVDFVVNFAARTFVDHSIRDPKPFIENNVKGAYNLLEDAKRHGVKKFVQVSTDEVYGAILEGYYDENARLNPTNPYSASKAGADALAISFAHTYGLNTIVTRTENNYGPFQHPQKVFPVFVKAIREGRDIPVYGDGGHVRQWLYVDDHVTAILKLLESDTPPGEVYHVAGSQELTNLELARKILENVHYLQSLYEFPHSESIVRLIDDFDIRPGHDRRYALDSSKIQALGWKPEVSLDDGIEATVKWYFDNDWWYK